ncbi:hypothetical protein B0H14DRAFT_3521143 [Mycena olivaceomarginata]|nr:hypothetical protein B0H14DRAFT_3521143 [Mycena olivaceomarginata]
MYNKAWAALIHLGHMLKDTTDPYLPLTLWDIGGTLHSRGVPSPLLPVKRWHEDEAKPQFLTGTQILKCAGSVVKSPWAPKRLKDIIPDDIVVDYPASSETKDSDLDMLPSKLGKLGWARGERKKKKGDGWIWLEKDRVQWFCAEAEMYRWLEAYECKHTEHFCVIARFRHNSVVWTGRADRDQTEKGGLTGTGAFAWMQAAMYQRLQHNTKVHFRSLESSAHHDWVTARTFDELVTKVDSWHDEVLMWMDGIGIHRAYKHI